MASGFLRLDIPTPFPTQWIRDQSGAVPSISTIATYPVSLIALIPDPMLMIVAEFYIGSGISSGS